MIDIGSYIVALFSILFLLGLHWLYKDYQVDKYRQRLFAIRDEFFIDSLRGAIPFDSKAYGLVRLLINSHIRFAHRLSFARMLLIGKFIKPEIEVLKEDLFDNQITKAKAELTDDQRDCVDLVLRQLHVLVIVQIVRRSVVLNTILTVVYYISVLLSLGAIGRKFVNRIAVGQASKVDTIAVTSSA